MSIVLCEECFADWAKVEVLTFPALTKCVECGRGDHVHLFRQDPRPPNSVASDGSLTV